MARIRPLTPEQAKRTLANRFGGLADRMRQLNTRFGVRPYRVFLRWTMWNGSGPLPERGEGDELDVLTIEVLPTPKLINLDSLSFSFWHAGQIPVGSVRLEEISIARFTEDILLGKAWPQFEPGCSPCDKDPTLVPLVAPMPGMDPREPHVPEPYEFFYEIVEDGRGDCPAKRSKFRPLNRPMRRAGKVDWTVMLERVSQDRTRDNKSSIGSGLEG
jgi:hypothetical protein